MNGPIMNIVSEEISDIVDHVFNMPFGDSPQNYVRLQVICKETHVCLSMTVYMDGIEFHLYNIIFYQFDRVFIFGYPVHVILSCRRMLILILWMSSIEKRGEMRL